VTPTQSESGRFKSPSAALAVLVAGLLLAGCVSLVPKSAPVQLYRLSQPAPPPAAPAPPGLSLARTAVSFPGDAASDRLLAFNGPEAAFIAGGRWIEPASVMFDQSVTDAFDQPGAPHLIGAGEGASSSATLRLAVRRFDANYDHGMGAAPTVEVTVDAALIRSGDRVVVAEKLFEIRQPASENRIGAIVEAYNVAVAEALGAVRDWSAVNAPPSTRR